MMMIDLVVTCPYCHERVALPEVAAETQLITTGDRGNNHARLTVKLYDIPSITHECRAMMSVAKSASGTAVRNPGLDEGPTGPMTLGDTRSGGHGVKMHDRHDSSF